MAFMYAHPLGFAFKISILQDTGIYYTDPLSLG